MATVLIKLNRTQYNQYIKVFLPKTTFPTAKLRFLIVTEKEGI